MSNRQLNWTQILVTALVTGAVTVATGMILSRLQAREPRLVYSTAETIPFAGQNQVVAIYQVSISNEGKKAVEDVDCHVRIPGATIDQWQVSIDPTVAYSDSVVGDAVKLHLSGLNPLEVAQLSVLASAPSNLPSRPEVSLRAKGVSGAEKPIREKEKPEWFSILPALLGALGGLLLSRGVLSFGEEEVDTGRHDADQRQVLAYLCGVHGLTEEMKRYLTRVPKASYWAEADRLASLAITSTNPEEVDKIRSVLKDLLRYAEMVESSRGIICYNIARIAAAAGNSDEMREYLTQARALIPKLLDTRLKIDPVFKEVRAAREGGDGA